MNENQEMTGFWDGEECEYCGGPTIDKQVTLHRTHKDTYILFERVPAGICKDRTLDKNGPSKQCEMWRHQRETGSQQNRRGINWQVGQNRVSSQTPS